MFFWLSKIFWLVFSPMTLLGLIFLLGLVLTFFQKSRKQGLWIFGAGAAIYIIMALTPLGHNALALLEKNAAVISYTELKMKNPQAVVLLGGCLNPIGAEQINQQTSYMNGSCERIVEAIYLKKKLGVPLVYSGGTGELNNREFTESESAKIFFSKMAISEDLLYEDQSRNTYENAINLQTVNNLDKNAGPVILVTSASHMPRASRVFCHAGWDIYPYSVDYQTDRELYILPNISSYSNLIKFNTAFKEYIGLIAYWITDKISLKACAKTLE